MEYEFETPCEVHLLMQAEAQRQSAAMLRLPCVAALSSDVSVMTLIRLLFLEELAAVFSRLQGQTSHRQKNHTYTVWYLIQGILVNPFI